MSEVQQRSMKEIKAILAAENARHADLMDAWENLTEDEQVQLVLFARSIIEKDPDR